MEKKDNYQRYKWTTIWVLSGTALGLITVIVFSATSGMSLGLLLLWSFAYFVMGGLLGFIFSVPKPITDINPQTMGVPNLSEETKEKARVATLKINLQENNNLTQISDWLAKVIIGATLVEIKEVPKFVLHVAEIMGKGLVFANHTVQSQDQATMLCVGIILFFSTWGFVCGYLIMKLVLTEQFADIGQ